MLFARVAHQLFIFYHDLFFLTILIKKHIIQSELIIFSRTVDNYKRIGITPAGSDPNNRGVMFKLANNLDF